MVTIVFPFQGVTDVRRSSYICMKSVLPSTRVCVYYPSERGGGGSRGYTLMYGVCRLGYRGSTWTLLYMMKLSAVWERAPSTYLHLFLCTTHPMLATNRPCSV